MTAYDETYSTKDLKRHDNSYLKHLRNATVALFLLLFTSSFVIESLAYNLNDIYQSELVDFEGDPDSEEDSKNEKEKEKENKLLTSIGLLLSANTQRIYLGHLILSGPNEEIEEVLSPPPELS
ncbi:MAG: hypothetical protein HEP71_13980 [Roseivirga sp.]|nr:hypothetical protein [Roseivirga sp.]